MKMRRIKPSAPRVNVASLLRKQSRELGFDYIHFGAWSPLRKPYTPRVFAGRAGEILK